VTRGIIVVCFWPPLVEWNGYPPRICLSRVRNLFELRLVVAINAFVIFILSFSARRFVIFEMPDPDEAERNPSLAGQK